MASFFSDDSASSIGKSDDELSPVSQFGQPAVGSRTVGVAASPLRIADTGESTATVALARCESGPDVVDSSKTTKFITTFSDDESSPDGSTIGSLPSVGAVMAAGACSDPANVWELERANGKLGRRSGVWSREVEASSGKATPLSLSTAERQESFEESAQSRLQEQHEWEAHWQGREHREQRLRELMRMEREDERASLQRGVLLALSQARAKLARQGAELLRHSEELAGENGRLEARVEAQAVCLEQQQGAAERSQAELLRLNGEVRALQAQRLVDAESAALEERTANCLRSELSLLREEGQSAPVSEVVGGALLQLPERAAARSQDLLCSSEESDAQRMDLQKRFVELEARDEMLQAGARSFKEELRAVSDLLSAERSERGHLEAACHRLGEDLERCRASATEHGHLEGTCRWLGERLLECRLSEELERRRMEHAHQRLQAESQESLCLEGLRYGHLEGAYQELEAELRASRHELCLEGMQHPRVRAVHAPRGEAAVERHRQPAAWLGLATAADQTHKLGPASTRARAASPKQPLTRTPSSALAPAFSTPCRLGARCWADLLLDDVSCWMPLSDLACASSTAVGPPRPPANQQANALMLTPASRANGTFQALTCAYAAAVVACETPEQQEAYVGEVSIRRVSFRDRASIIESEQEVGQAALSYVKDLTKSALRAASHAGRSELLSGTSCTSGAGDEREALAAACASAGRRELSTLARAGAGQQLPRSVTPGQAMSVGGGARGHVTELLARSAGPGPAPCSGSQPQAQVAHLEAQCEQQQQLLAARNAEVEQLRSKVGRLSVGTADGQVPCQAAQREVARRESASELSEAQAQSRLSGEGEAAHVEWHCRAEELEQAQGRLLLVEAQAVTLAQELRQWQAQTPLLNGGIKALATLAGAPSPSPHWAGSACPMPTKEGEALPAGAGAAASDDAVLQLRYQDGDLIQRIAAFNHVLLDIQRDCQQAKSFSHPSTNDSVSHPINRRVASSPRPRSLPCSPRGSVTPQQSPKGSPMTRKRLAGVAQSSAAAVATLLQQVRSFNEPQASLAGSPRQPDGESACAAQVRAMQALEQQTRQLERANHEWASSLSRLLPEGSKGPAVAQPAALRTGAECGGTCTPNSARGDISEARHAQRSSGLRGAT